MGGPPMTRRLSYAFSIFALLAISSVTFAQLAPLHILAFYSTDQERDHVMFAEEAVQFFTNNAKKDNLNFQWTTNWNDLNSTRLKEVLIVVWLSASAHTQPQQAAFEQYMQGGG